MMTNYNPVELRTMFVSTTNVTEQKSVMNAYWQPLEVEERDVLAIKQKFMLPELVARVIAGRNVNIENIDNFLQPTLRSSLPDPFHLLGMNEAVQRIKLAISKNEKIAVFGDYDVDGATSSALLKRYFRNLNIEITIYIPDRMSEGYGPNEAAFLHLKNLGIDLCITVDCGTLAHKQIAYAQSINLDVIVIDHHLSTVDLPKAVAVVNPNRLDELSSYGYLAAVGVTFLVLVALNKSLREDGKFHHCSEPNLIHMLDLVALGTVCDVMKIVGLNRVFVAQGLQVMSQRKNCGIASLCDLIGIEERLTAQHLGFSIGPHINAGGRIGKSDLGATLLATDDNQVAKNIAVQLQELNSERKIIENEGLKEANFAAEKQLNSGTNVIVVAGNWHPGIIGIIAGRLKETFYLPSVVISVNDGIGKASARSISGIDIGSAVLSAKIAGLIIEGGGHAMAAGFSIAEDKISELHSFLSERFTGNITQRITKFDCLITVAGININLFNQIKTIGPFGVGNPEPRFVLIGIKIAKVQTIGVNHIRCLIVDNGKFLNAIAFRAADNQIGASLVSGKATAILGKISINYWGGNESIQFVIEDVMI